MMHADRKPPLISLLILVSFASVGAVCFSPALPDITRAFATTKTYAQHLIMWFLVGYALGQLPYGPLGSSFGNRKITLIMLWCSVVFSALCFLAIPTHSIGFLSVVRFLLGLSMCVGLKMAYTFVGLYYEKEVMTQKTSYFMLSFALAPSLSLLAVGWLVSWLGYIGAFYFQFAYCLAALAWAYTLPPDRHQEKKKLEVKSVVQTFYTCFKNPRVVFSGALMATAASLYYLFSAESPFIAIDHLKEDPGIYGLFFFLATLGIFFGGLSGAKFSQRFSRTAFMITGLGITSLGSLAILIAFASHLIDAYTLFVPVFVILWGTSLYHANSASFAMKEDLDKSYIAATMNFVNVGTTVIFVLILSLYQPKNLMIMPSLFVLLALFGWVIYAIQSRLARTVR